MEFKGYKIASIIVVITVFYSCSYNKNVKNDFNVDDDTITLNLENTYKPIVFMFLNNDFSNKENYIINKYNKISIKHKDELTYIMAFPEMYDSNATYSNITAFLLEHYYGNGSFPNLIISNSIKTINIETDITEMLAVDNDMNVNVSLRLKKILSRDSLHFYSEVVFSEDIIGNYYLSVFIVEDIIAATPSSSSLLYRNVLRGQAVEDKNNYTLDYFNSIFGSIINSESKIINGKMYKNSFSINIEKSWNINNLKTVIVVWKKIDEDRFIYVNSYCQ